MTVDVNRPGRTGCVRCGRWLERCACASVNIASMTSPKIPPHGLRELKDASRRAKTAVATRNARIRYWHKQGCSLREIAEACGTITHSAVARIVAKPDDE